MTAITPPTIQTINLEVDKLKEELDKEYNRDYLMVKCDLSKEDEIDKHY